MNDVMPTAVRLATDGCKVEVWIEGRRMGTITTLEHVDDEGRYSPRFVAGCVTGVLSVVQDDVSEFLRDAWPSRDGRTMAMPDARLDEQSLDKR